MNSFFVSTLHAAHFRNLGSFHITAHPSLNVFFGRNGQGKTNIIEAISLALSTKALRTVKDASDLIAHGAEKARIELKCSGESPLDCSVQIEKKGKKIELFGKAIRDAGQLLDKVTVLSFVPDDLQIVHASAAHRRKAINQITAGFFPSYLSLYRKFERALASRNQLLKSPYFDPLALASFDDVFAGLACEVTRYRSEALMMWRPFFLESIKEIVGDRFSAEAQYQPFSLADKDAFLAELKEAHSAERMRKVSLCGPQLDDLLFHLDGRDARFIASRGQARALVLALKIGQLNAIMKLRQKPVVLLLDDVAGELDPEKVGFLMRTVSTLGIQTFLTTTHLESLFSFTHEARCFEIEEGSLVAARNTGC